MACQGGDKKARNMVSSSEYCYSDISSNNPNLQPHLVINNHLQGFEPSPEIFNLTTGMEMIGFFGGKTTATGGGGASSSKTIDDSSTVDYYQDHNLHHHQFNNSEGWVDHSRSLLVVDDVFPCEGNEINRPSQGLSLSLSSTNPPTIGLQSFELRQQQDDGYFGKSVIQDGFLGKFTNLQQHGHQFQMRHSKYLGPAQELLIEFCNLGITKHQTETKSNVLRPHQTSQWNEENPSTSSSKNKSPLCTLELLELQRRKTKLLSMLEEVDRRYRHYCDQMKAVVSSFEAVAGDGAAAVYSALASKAMSRHFRCLRDGIVGQIKATKKAMGEKDTAVAPGTTRGETPRLRILDQTLRQQRVFQQMTVMETHPWRPQRGLPERSVSVLRAWLFEHFLHPYPSDVDKHILARQTGLSRSQVANWFINARVRLWKPMVEEMYMEETKEQDNLITTSSEDNNIGRPNQNPQTTHPEDQKPTPVQLVRIDSECLSSIINHPEKNNNDMTKQSANKSPQNQSHHGFGRVDDTFGAMELDFSAYNHHGGGGGGGGSAGGVTLTLGLQQHGGGGGPGGVSLAFSPASQNSLFYAGRDHMEECQQVQYSLLESDHHQGQNLPYRNLMGAQLLHDLAG